MRMQTPRTKELMLLHGKLKQSEAKYSAIRDLMSGENIFFSQLSTKINYIEIEERFQERILSWTRCCRCRWERWERRWNAKTFNNTWFRPGYTYILGCPTMVIFKHVAKGRQGPPRVSKVQGGPQGWVRWVLTRSIIFKSFSYMIFKIGPFPHWKPH